MTLFTPVYDTPLNQPGLAHKATLLELNKRADFNPVGGIYTHTHEGEDKSSFTIAYRLRKNEIVYARYRVIFEDGQKSPYSPTKIITSNTPLKEYSLDRFSSVPATPKLTILDYNNSDMPHEDITVKISDLNFYMGDGILLATSWYLKDANDKILWKSEKDKFNLNSIVISKDYFKEDGVYKIEACRVIKTGLLTYNSLNGVKVINVSSTSGYTNEDRALDVDYDNFQLYGNRQSILKFKQKIQGFQYLSIKVYDRNNILVLDEITAEKSPVYINTVGLSIGKEYTIRTTAFYLDAINGIGNTRLESKEFIAETAPENNTIMIPDYKDMVNLGFKELREYKDENISLINMTENLNNGEAFLFIRDNLLFIGKWLESGMVFSNKFINISKLNYSKTCKKIQIIQKPNGDYLVSFIKGVIDNKEELKVICFREVETNNNVKDILILQEATLLTNTDLLHRLDRYVFTNITSQNIIVALDGTDKTKLTIYELIGNTLLAKAEKEYEILDKTINVFKSSQTSLLVSVLDNGNFKAKNIPLIDLSVLDLNLEDIAIDETDIKLKNKLSDISTIGNTGGKLKIDGMIIKKNILFFSIENNTADASKKVFQYFKYNISTEKLELVNNISDTDKGYEHKVIYGYNYIKIKENSKPLILIAE